MLSPSEEEDMTYVILQGAERSAPTIVVRTKADLRNLETSREVMDHVKTLVDELGKWKEVNA